VIIVPWLLVMDASLFFGEMKAVKTRHKFTPLTLFFQQI
jgi:hypothetical protein